jgi:putative RecB family exonuclease
MPIEHLSYSSINQYVECGLQYRFRKIDNLTPEHTSDALVFGSCVHKVLARFNKQRSGHINCKAHDLTRWFEEFWVGSTKNNGQIKYSNGNDFDTCLERGKKLLEIFHENNSHITEYSIMEIEKEFRLELEDFPYPIIGYIDLVERDEEGNLLITEYKTSGKSYSSSQVDRHDQVTLYHMAIQNMFPENQVISKIDVLIKTKVPKFEQYYTYRDSDDHQRFIKTAREVAKGIQAGVFIPNRGSWKCSSCEYKTACDNWLTS